MVENGVGVLSEARAIFWKEIRELPRLLDKGWSQLAGFAAIVAYLAWSTPDILIEPSAGASVGAMGGFFAFLLAPHAFAGERERHTLETLLSTQASGLALILGKVLATTLLSWVAFTTFTIAIGATAMAIHGPSQVDPVAVAVSSALCLPSSALVATIGALVSLRAKTVMAAQQRLMVGLFVAAVPPVALGVWLLATDRLPESVLAVLGRGIGVLVEVPGPLLVMAATLATLACTAVLLMVGTRLLFRREDLADLL